MITALPASARAAMTRHLGLGADIDAASVVENEDCSSQSSQFGEHHLLLIAAAQRINRLVAARRLDAERDLRIDGPFRRRKSMIWFRRQNAPNRRA